MRVLISTAQILAYFLFYLPVRLLYRTRRRVAPAVRELQRGRYIVTANHQCRMDPFLILSLLPFKPFLKLVPIRFITADQYMNTWWEYSFLSLFGCFPITPRYSPRKPVIEYAVELLQAGQTLFIFPEGKRLDDGEKAEAKRGAIVIAEQANAQLLPAQIDGMSFTQRQGKRAFEVHFGSPLIMNDRQTDVTGQAQVLMQHVHRLHFTPQAYYGPSIRFTDLGTLRGTPIPAPFALAYSIEDDTRSADMTNQTLVPAITG